MVEENNMSAVGERNLIIRRKVFRVGDGNTILIDPYRTLRRAKLVAGEKIRAGQMVYVGADGKMYVA